MSGIPRKRASLSCAECNRRKVKCDKSIPCGRCVENGVAASCRRSGRVRSGKSATWQTPVTTDQHDAESESNRLPTAREETGSRPHNGDHVDAPNEQDEIVNAATILEFLAWGKRKEVSYATVLPSYVDEQPPVVGNATPSMVNDELSSTFSKTPETGMSMQMLQILLPEREKVQTMVDYHVDYLLWYHGSFHGPTLQQQLRDFYNCHRGNLSSPGLDLRWASLLFSVLTGAMTCGNKKVVLSWGFGPAEQELLSRKWLQATVTCLNTAEYMANPSILSCEAIATLTVSAHILGYSNQQAILLASAVRIAQSLGLHRLNDTSNKSTERETGRRVWSQLCSQDWFSIPFSECYLVNPMYSQTLPPINCDDITLAYVPETYPTVTSYCRYLHSIAALMPGLQDGITRSNTLFTKYDQVMTFDRKMRIIASEQRPIFLSNAPLDTSWPRWVVWARRAAAISSSHKIIMIHRNFLILSFTNPAFDFTRRTCIAASKTILKEASSVDFEDGPVLWIFHAFTVAAGVTLCLDALHRKPTDPVRTEHCRLVQDAIEQLRYVHNSKIASRGTKVLADILEVERNSRLSTGKRKAIDISRCGVESRTEQSIDIGHVVRDLQRRTSPQAARSKKGSSIDDPNTALCPELSRSIIQGFHQQGGVRLEYSHDPETTNLCPVIEHPFAGFHPRYNFHSHVDAFGSLLSLAQNDPPY